MSTVQTLHLSVALLLLSATTAFAADDEKDNTDFLLNVFSDIGPILALFGEQFARQFLSETFTWEDHIIFACIPLGIMTAISGAIRVQGNGLFRAVIGRARENHAAAEIEYMSSTSTEVCELYNGEGIVRTMGKPYIGQIIICPDDLPTGKTKPDKHQTGTRTTPHQRSNGTETNPNQVPNGAETDPDRRSNRTETDPDQVPNDAKTESERFSYRIHTLETAKTDRIMVYQGTSYIHRTSYDLADNSATEYQEESRPPLFKRFGPSPKPKDANQDASTQVTGTSGDLEAGTVQTRNVMNSDSHGPRQETSNERGVPLQQLPRTPSRRVLRKDTRPNGLNLSSKKGSNLTLATNVHNTEKKNPWLTLRSSNLQLNIPCEDVSERKHRSHLVLAAMVALTLQVALLVIAVSTVHFVSGFEPEPWGLPCYLGGSVLLFLGMLACSVAIEKRTRELTWYIPVLGSDGQEKRKEFRLFWVQRNQRVSEQDFGSYIIDGGTRNHVMTSSRCKDLEGLEKSNSLANDPSKSPTGTTDTPSDQPEGSKEPQELSFLPLLPLIAVLFGGVGFTVQFIGLRGLPWPCAVSQLGAMILMAIIRALIRRRLTKSLIHYPVLQKHELDYLAIRLVETEGDVFKDHPANDKTSRKPWAPRAAIKSILKKLSGDENDHKHQLSAEILVWKVDTKSIVTFGSKKGSSAKSMDKPIFMQSHNTDNTDAKLVPNPTESPGSDPDDKGQSAIFVRKRLGDLCKWPDSTSKPALALTLSIEKFMTDFFPDGLSTDSPKQLACKIPFSRSPSSNTNKSLSSSNQNTPSRSSHQTPVSWINLDIAQEPEGKVWTVDSGQVQAILSLWMAHWTARRVDHLEAESKHGEKQVSTDWRRAGDGSHVEYCRRLGENRHGVLKRDISWWVNNAVEGLQTEHPESPELPHDYASSGSKESRFSFGFNCLDAKGGSETPEFLVQHSTADLATLMAQHLFTCFMWNIGGLLPKNLLNRADININEFVKVESSRLFNLRSSIRAQCGRRLSHRQLTKFVNYAEKQGLGTPDDILLCIIPTFSFFDCLPNNAVLAYDQLLPKPFGSFDLKEQGGKCIEHANLLDCVRENKGMKENEYLSLAAVVNTMEFVYLMALHVDKAKVCGASKKTHPEEFVHLLKLLLEHFHNYLRRLSPFYELQRRRETLKSLFERLEIGTNNNDTWPTVWKGGDEEEVEEAFKHNIGFGKWHCEIAKTETKGCLDLQLMLHSEDKTGTARDIFGWTPLHYAAARPDLNFKPEEGTPKTKELEATLNRSFQTKRWVDKFRRSPIHIAAAAGNINLLGILLPSLNDEATSAIFKGGVDEMDPLHLATRGNHENCKRGAETGHPTKGNSNKCIIALLQHRPKTQNDIDVWKQSPIQTAVTHKCYECTLSLLKNNKLNFSPEATDEFENTLLFYLKENDEQHCLIGKELLLKHYQKFELRKSGSDNILHHAVKFLGSGGDFSKLLDTLRDSITSSQPPLNINVANKHGQTPLNLAIETNKPQLINCLITAGASSSAQDNDGYSPMILACQRGDPVSAMALLQDAKYRGDEVDTKKQSALHHAASSSKWHKESDRLEVAKRIAYVMKSIDLRDQEDKTPLQCAVEANRTSVCLSLLRRKASIKLVDISRLSALNDIVRSNPDQDFQADLETEKKLRSEWESQIRTETKNRVNDQDKDGHTSLHRAIYEGDHKAAVWLMENKANLRIKNNSGTTAFIEACRLNKCHRFIKYVVDVLNSKSTAREVLQQEADMNTQQLGLSKADLWSNDSKLFDINEGDSFSDQSALAWACERGHQNVVKILLTANKVDLRRKASGHLYYTPLHIALLNNKDTVVKVLLNHPEGRLLLHDEDEFGRTPIQFAIRHPYQACLYQLVMNSTAGPSLFSCEELTTILKICAGRNVQVKDQTQNAWDEKAEEGFLDADNWTLADIAGKYGHPDLEGHLRKKLGNSTKISPLQPSVFSSNYSGLKFTDTSIHGQDHRITMDVAFSGSSLRHFYFRTKEPIAPKDSDFYFEVKILHLPKNQVFMMGFCGEDIPEDRAPGWDRGSWAYHADDGGLYEGKSWAAIIEDPKHICSKGNVMRCGVNLNTGKGYRTRDGIPLASGDAFRDDWLKTGKLYPCVGFRDDGYGDELKVEIVLPSSDSPSYESVLSQTEWARTNLLIINE
ncbi:hypothetical protein HG531_009565 [Fusarium graminearum]|nr:hypothetical protein HG531_009565 [Fusarium graminearum]